LIGRVVPVPIKLDTEGFATTTNRLSRIERGLTRDPDLQTQIHAWLTQLDTAQIAA